jgi:ribosomal protein S28E/S33
MGDGAETIVPWDDVNATAILGELDQVRLDAYLASERERSERRHVKGPLRDKHAGRVAPRESTGRRKQERQGNVVDQKQGGTKRNAALSSSNDPPPVYGGQTKTFEVRMLRSSRSVRGPAEKGEKADGASLALDGDFIERIGGYLTMNTK